MNSKSAQNVQKCYPVFTIYVTSTGIAENFDLEGGRIENPVTLFW